MLPLTDRDRITVLNNLTAALAALQRANEIIGDDTLIQAMGVVNGQVIKFAWQ